MRVDPGARVELRGGVGFGCAAPRSADRLSRSSAPRGTGLQPVRWPSGSRFDSTVALRRRDLRRRSAAAVAFSLAAFRQAYAGGRDLSVADNVLIAAAACEMHPRAVLKAVELRSAREARRAATAAAVARGVLSVPAIWCVGEPGV